MFTIEYIKEWSEKHQRINTKNLEEFLQEHGLLSEDTEGETCEHESDGGVYITLRKEGEEQKPPQSKCTKCKKFYRN